MQIALCNTHFLCPSKIEIILMAEGVTPKGRNVLVTNSNGSPETLQMLMIMMLVMMVMEKGWVEQVKGDQKGRCRHLLSQLVTTPTPLCG